MICILVGTNRPDCKTKLIAREITSIYSRLGHPVQELDLAELPPEIFERTSYARKPDSFQPFIDTILASDGLVIVAPEYNGGPPGILKYFIDMLPFPESFERRPVCFVGLAAGRWGALRPIEQLQQIFGYRNAFLFPERVFVPEVHRLVDEQGNLTDPELLLRLEKQAAGFIDFVKSVPVRTAGPNS